MRNLLKTFVRNSSFIGKETIEILRQTRLLLALVLGPFLILLFFGLGYRNEARPLRTLFVIPDNGLLREQVDKFAETMEGALIYQGTVTEENQALDQLRLGRVDLVVVIPKAINEVIRNGEQATFNLYHNEIDPNQVGYVEYVGKAYTDEANRAVIQSIIASGQDEASTLEQKIESAHQKIRSIRSALEQDRTATVQQEKASLDEDLDLITMLAASSVSMMQGTENLTSSVTFQNTSEGDNTIKDTLERISQNRETINTLDEQAESVEEVINNLDQMEQNLDTLKTQLSDFQSVSPYVLAAPFNSQVSSIAGIGLTPIGFFAPAVIVLLLQHLVITLSALSLVRERQSGAMELFKISPLSTFEILSGKYWSYMLSGSLLAVIITLTAVLILKIPMLGMWINYALILLLLLFASLGLGFLISLISETDTQAVQYTMFFLLVSVFFSGFFLDLRYMRDFVKIISWALPATYGIQSLHDIMLRSIAPNLVYPLSLLGMGIAFFILSWWILRKQMRSE